MRRGAAFGFFRADVGPEHPLHGQDILFGRLAAQASRSPLHREGSGKLDRARSRRFYDFVIILEIFMV